ncbi:MAG: dihydropteroate synthase [Puniceicoccales bacterium]|jgi:dihydropteroate synthase|nr:dihydropteroate synthase [Puniceicoccales bacterium]
MSKSFSQITLPCIMGILNITPDSFSDGGNFFDQDDRSRRQLMEAGSLQPKAVQRLYELVDQGGTIIDIGGESTNPQAIGVDANTEWQRIGNVLEVAIAIDSISVSVDTYRPEIAQLALKRGANIINDVCCTWHFREMATVVKDFDAHLIVTHNARNDKNFLQTNDPVGNIISEFEKILDAATLINFDVERIIFDPGIGFGKTAQQNLEIFRTIGKMCSKFPNPIICATSKKSFLSAAINCDAWKALSNATIATTMEGFRQGCKIFRVHDVMENLVTLKFAQKLYE